MDVCVANGTLQPLHLHLVGIKMVGKMSDDPLTCLPFQTLIDTVLWLVTIKTFWTDLEQTKNVGMDHAGPVASWGP